MKVRLHRDTEKRGWASKYDVLIPRLRSVCLVSVVLLSAVPTASAHDTSAVPIPRWYGLVVLVGGLAVLGASVFLKRTQRISPTTALHGVFGGIVVAAIGGVGFTELSPDTFYTASSMPFPQAWYQPLALGLGFTIMVGSVLLGRFRWPTRPRYSMLGIELGLWVSYPGLITGGGEYAHPLGYAIVLSVPLTVGYILWTDCLETIRAVLRDQTARRFGGGIALVVALFFMFVSGFLSFFPQEGVNMPQTTTISVLPTLFPLVTWPAVEWYFPSVPFIGMLSIGVVIVVGLICGLVGLFAAITARVWTAGATTDLSQSTAGTVTFVGSCPCSCCGPMVAKFIIIAVGPSAAAPIYWVFVDLASPAGALFLVSSIALLTANLLQTVEAVSESPACTLEGSTPSPGIRAD